jgi:homoserine kinase type II
MKVTAHPLPRSNSNAYTLSMEEVYVLWFEREYPDREDTEIQIGIYASAKDAGEAISLLKDQPGFRDYPEGFQIYPTKLGVTGWQQGFVTEYIPAKERDAADPPA